MKINFLNACFFVVIVQLTARATLATSTYNEAEYSDASDDYESATEIPQGTITITGSLDDKDGVVDYDCYKYTVLQSGTEAIFIARPSFQSDSRLFLLSILEEGIVEEFVDGEDKPEDHTNSRCTDEDRLLLGTYDTCVRRNLNIGNYGICYTAGSNSGTYELSLKPSAAFEATPMPSDPPTAMPSKRPTAKPTSKPTSSPTANPSKRPTERPTSKPTSNPTANPSKRPTERPTSKPTSNPTANPTSMPTSKPTNKPTSHPTKKPTKKPTKVPTKKPSKKPLSKPTKAPKKRNKRN